MTKKLNNLHNVVDFLWKLCYYNYGSGNHKRFRRLKNYGYYEKKVNLQLAILRGIKEELGVDEHYLLKDSLKMYDVFINHTAYDIYFY